MVVAALTPFLVLSSALPAVEGMVAAGVGLGRSGIEMSAAMADAAYCFGTVLAVQLVTRLPGQRLLVLYAAVCTLASVAIAITTDPAIFFAGRIFQGLTTSLMLITAAPALVIGWPTSKLRWTAMVMNLGIFGAVALGPVIGGAFAGLGVWRPMFWGAAGVAGVAFLFVLLTFEDRPPQDLEVPIDLVSLLLAASGCVSAFVGVAALSTHALGDAVVLIPLLSGIGLIIALIIHQSSIRDPLIPVRKLGHTIPIAAIALALFSGAGSLGLVALVQVVLEAKGLSSALFWPEFGGALVTAYVFGRLFATRYVPILAAGGFAILIVTAILVLVWPTGPSPVVAMVTGGIGLGVGASVAPSIFIAGFSLPAFELPRIFSLVELLRGVAAFVAAPLIAHAAVSSGTGLAGGVTAGAWWCLGCLLAGGLVIAVVLLAGGARLQRPDLEGWLGGRGPAIHSPALWARVRGRNRVAESGRTA